MREALIYVVTCFGRHSDCSYESVLFCKFIQELLSHLFFKLALFKVFYEVVLVDYQDHGYGLVVLKCHTGIYLLLPVDGLFYRLSVADVSYHQCPECTSTEKFVDSSNSRVLTNQVP